MLDWDDLHSMLAVANHGSTLAAGKALKVSQTTVARRISALEATLGTALFYRQQSGYRPTLLCEALLQPARARAREAETISAITDAYRRQLKSTVRVSSTELYGVTILPPLLQKLHDAHPDIHVELDMSDERRDLATGAADVAMRIGPMPTDAGLKIRRVANDRWAVYCSVGYSQEYGIPTNIEQMKGRPFIGGGGPYIWRIYSDWLQTAGLEDAVTIHFNNALGLLAAVRSGAGLSVLPMIIAENLPDLVRCLPPARDHRPIWVATHERSANDPAVRTVSLFLAENLSRLPGG